MRPAIKDRGFVLANALILIAALSAVAVSMLADRYTARERIALTRDAVDADLITEAGVLFATDLLRRDAGAAPVDHGGEAWALDRYPAEIDGRVVEISVTDLSGMFGVNSLRGPEHEAAADALDRLAELSETDLGVILSRVAAGVVEKPRDEPHLFQTGDIAHLSEIATEADELRAIAKLVATLPMAQKINVNAAPALVLAAVTGLDESAAETLILERRRTPFRSVEDFVEAAERLGASPSGIRAALLTTNSAWFRVETRVTVGDVSRNVATVLARDPQTGDVRALMKGPSDASDG